MRAGILGMAAAIAAIALGGLSASARPLTPAEKRFLPFYSDMPACADEDVLRTVQNRFEQREDYFWKSGLKILRFETVREAGLRPNGLDYMPRRYCSARAMLNDGSARATYFWVGENQDMTGDDAFRSVAQGLTLGLLPRFNPSPVNNWGVEWCVVGLDRNYAYAKDCKAVRP
jgi:hypothetical protein